MDEMTAAKRAQTAKANEARRRQFLERHEDEYAAALRELGYTVTRCQGHTAIDVWQIGTPEQAMSRVLRCDGECVR
jgi:hypothetical protein